MRLAVFLLATLLSLAYSFGHRIELASDARVYDAIAANVVAGHGFTPDVSIDPASAEAIFCTCPGYPFFLTGIYWLFGHHVELVWAAQALLHGLSTLLVFLIAARLFRSEDARLPMVAAALY